MKNFTLPHLYKLLPGHMEKKSELPSQTVPNETMSIKEIMDRFKRGQKVDDAHMRLGSYDSGASLDSVDLESVNRMDLSEREELSNELKQQNQEKLSFLEKKKQDKKATEDRLRSEGAQRSESRKSVKQDVSEWEKTEAKRKVDDRSKNPAKKQSDEQKSDPDE